MTAPQLERTLFDEYLEEYPQDTLYFDGVIYTPISNDVKAFLRSRPHTPAPCALPELCSLLMGEKKKVKQERERVLCVVEPFVDCETMDIIKESLRSEQEQQQ
jgi:hypothetical protein